MISDLDEHVGTLMKRLEDHGLVDNTLVVFTSDNGPTHGSRNPDFHVGGAACKFFNSNGGLKGYKGSADEGGIRVPCIVRWPGRVPANSVVDFPSYFPDWFPTLAEVAGAALPTGQTLDGVSLVDVMRGLPGKRDKPMIWEFGGYGGIIAVRDGEWKALRRNFNRKQPGDWELYNIAQDPSESKDLAEQHPEIVQRLEQAFLNDRTVEPDFPNPLYDNVN
jgi:arylsulfatase